MLLYFFSRAVSLFFSFGCAAVHFTHIHRSSIFTNRHIEKPLRSFSFSVTHTISLLCTCVFAPIRNAMYYANFNFHSTLYTAKHLSLAQKRIPFLFPFCVSFDLFIFFHFFARSFTFYIALQSSGSFFLYPLCVHKFLFICQSIILLL